MGTLESATSAVIAAPSLPEPREIDVAGINTRYYDIGDGPETIIFIYGGSFGVPDATSSAYAWNMNVRALAQKYRVIAFDKLGQGYTDVPLRDEDYTMGAVVRHVCAFMDALKLPASHLVGHSRGGFVATRVALERPDLTRSLSIVTSGTLGPGVGTNEVVLASPPHAPLTREAVRWVYSNYCYKPSTVTEDWVDVVMDVLQQPNYQKGVAKIVGEQLGIRLFLPDLARMKRETLTWLNEGRLQRPVQIIWGFNDRTVVVERGMELFNILAAHERRVTLNLFNQSGHFPYREHPERFNALLDRFVDLYKA
jgi:2-hydroxy-6-oxonona-2,4-dienedioate hydrolase